MTKTIPKGGLGVERGRKTERERKGRQQVRKLKGQKEGDILMR